MSEEDQLKLQLELEKLQTENDELFNTVMERLR